MAIYIYIFVAVLGMAILKITRTLSAKKDSTAEGVAKIRHCESILENPEERLYVDPYAHLMYFGSEVQTRWGGNKTRQTFDSFMKGLFDHLTLRTKWIDDTILERATGTAEQLVILGAGFDTRGFRLDLPDGFTVWEVDQPYVQSKKRKILESIATTDPTVAKRLDRNGASSAPHVEFLEVDFNKDLVSERLIAAAAKPDGDSGPSFDSTKTTIVTLEGVSQYIPKSATASTLKQVRSVIPEGSTLLISYVPTEVMEHPELAMPKSPGRLKLFLKMVGWLGEPWISTWASPDDFASFLRDSGYDVVEDVGFAELNQKYLVPRGRGFHKDDLCILERYVAAKVV